MEIENYSDNAWFASTLIEFNYENAKSKKSSNAVSQSSSASVNQEVNIIEFRTTDTKEVVSTGAQDYDLCPKPLVNETKTALAFGTGLLQRD